MEFNNLIKRIDNFNEGISLIHVIVLSCVLALCSIVYTQGGILYGEMYIRLPFYMSDMPLLNKLFDSKILDDYCYRARELSYFLDVIDFGFVKFSIEKGFPHFLSLTHYIFSIATGCVLWSFCVKELNLKPLMGVGWLLLFWTSPAIFLSALNRTGKIWVTLLTAILFYFLYKVAVASKKRFDSQFSKESWFLYFIIIFMMVFIDEQGIFLGITSLLFLIIWNFFVRNKNIYVMIWIGAGVMLTHGLYRYLIAPALTLIINGYRPDFSFQELPVLFFMNNPATSLLSGLSLYIDSFRFLTGNLPVAVAYGLLILFILFPFYYLYSSKTLPDNDKKFFMLSLAALLIISFFMLIMMHSFMVLKSPNLMWPEFRRVYYWSPTVITLAMTLAVLTKIFYKLRVSRWFIITGMCLAVIGNIIALPEHKAIILNQGYFQPYVQPSTALLRALKNIEPSKEIYDPLIKKNPVFQFFASKNKDLPDGSSAYNKRGIFHAHLGLHKLAVEDFYLAIKLKQDAANTVNRVVSYQELNQYRRALEEKDDLLLKQDYAKAYNNRGIDSARQGYHEMAIANFSEAIFLKPDFAFAWNNRGLIELMQGNTQRGCRDLQKACGLGNCLMLKNSQISKLCR